MKQIKLIIAATALLGLIASCEKDFTVQTGDTPVEFVYSSIDTTLNNTYIFIPVRAIAENELSTFTTVEYLGGTYTLKEDPSKTAELVDGSDIIFTSKELYVGAYDKDTDSTLGYSYNNIEIRVPDYLNYQSITFKLRLTGDYLGSVTEMTYTATAPSDVDFAGTWVLGTAEFVITQNESGNYVITDPFFGDSWEGTRSSNTLTLNSASGNTFNVGDPHGDVTATFCGYHPEDGGDGTVYLWPSEPCVFDFTSTTITTVNGVFIGFNSPADGKWYNWSGSNIDAGTVGSKK